MNRQEYDRCKAYVNEWESIYGSDEIEIGDTVIFTEEGIKSLTEKGLEGYYNLATKDKQYRVGQIEGDDIDVELDDKRWWIIHRSFLIKLRTIPQSD